MSTLLGETATAAGLYTLTAACPDTTGIVATITGFLPASNALITEAQHHDDPIHPNVLHAHLVPR